MRERSAAWCERKRKEMQKNMLDVLVDVAENEYHKFISRNALICLQEIS